MKQALFSSAANDSQGSLELKPDLPIFVNSSFFHSQISVWSLASIRVRMRKSLLYRRRDISMPAAFRASWFNRCARKSFHPNPISALLQANVAYPDLWGFLLVSLFLVHSALSNSPRPTLRSFCRELPTVL